MANPFLTRMGFSETDRVLITHIDDVGFCHAANLASFECLALGAASSASVLTNAPWFPEAAAVCRDNPEYDMGVHLTLTAEWDTFRWAPLSSLDPASGLMDAEGYLWRSVEEVTEHVNVDAARSEMRAQVEKALSARIDVTHVDTHMGTVIHPKFLGAYLQVAQEFGVPAMLPRRLRDAVLNPDDHRYGDEYLDVIKRVADDSVPTVDTIIHDTYKPVDNKLAFYRKFIDELQPGLTHLLFHCAKQSDELRAASGESSVWRDQDYRVFTDPDMKRYIEDSGAKLIGYRELKAHLQ